MDRRLRWTVVALLLVLAVPAALARAEPAVDGPYVLEGDGRRWELRLARAPGGGVVVRREPLARDEVVVEVDAPRALRFTVPLRAEHPRAPVDVAMPARLFVASDFEGEFDAFVALLRGNRVVDGDLRWSYGTGHLVLVGDLVDRGRNVVPLLWLVYRLEAEAQAAGGRVHYVLGNHEQKLLTGRTDDAHPKYAATARSSGEAPAALWDARSELGRWLRSKPVVLKVGDSLFMHGGLSPAVLALAPTLEEIDRYAAAAFAAPRAADARARAVLWERSGVLWYRGLATAPRASAAHVDAALRHFGVRRLVIGHTLARAVGSDYGGKVVRVDVHHASGTVEGAIVEHGVVARVDTTGTRYALEPAVNLDR